jgi:hypothetical protein
MIDTIISQNFPINFINISEKHQLANGVFATNLNTTKKMSNDIDRKIRKYYREKQ